MIHDTARTTIIHNRAKCNLCGDILESEHRHDFKMCRCGNLMVDGGKDYIRRGCRDGPETITSMDEIIGNGEQA